MYCFSNKTFNIHVQVYGIHRFSYNSHLNSYTLFPHPLMHITSIGQQRDLGKLNVNLTGSDINSTIGPGAAPHILFTPQSI